MEKKEEQLRKAAEKGSELLTESTSRIIYQCGFLDGAKFQKQQELNNNICSGNLPDKYYDGLLRSYQKGKN